jgi:hypothetical protein
VATHSFKGQKAKNGAVKPKLDALYTTSLIGKFCNVQNHIDKCMLCRQGLGNTIKLGHWQ